MMFKRLVAFIVSVAISLPSFAFGPAFVPPNPLFINQLQTTLVPQRSGTTAGAVPTLTRASTAYACGYGAADVLPLAAYHIAVASGEARFTGARRISESVWSAVDANGVALTSTNGATGGCNDARGPYGYQAEGARSDVLGTTAAIRRTMTDVGWVVGATMTVGAATGTDRVASAGASLTGGAVTATNTVLFTTVLGSAARTFSAWVRRKTGTGTIEMTDNGGTNWTDITSTLTTTYKLFQVTRTQANPIVGFRITTNADAIEVDWNTLEAASFANPTPIPLNVSKAADVLTYPTAGNVSGTVGSVYLEAMLGWGGTSPSNRDAFTVSNAAAGHTIGVQQNDATTTQWFRDGTNVNVATGLTDIGTALRATAISYGGSTMSMVRSGAAAQSFSFDGDITPVTLGVGCDLSGNVNWFGTIRFIKLFPVALSAAKLQAMPTP